MNTSELATQTPVEIDTQIATTLSAIGAHRGLIVKAERHLRQSGDDERTQERIDQANDRIAEHQTILDALDGEFDRRGGWNRVFVVEDGHVHRSQACRNGYHPTTVWCWIPAQSGREWADIMAEAGDRMCSWCFPEADNEYRQRASTIEHPNETEKRRKRELRETQRAERTAHADAKKVLDPDTGKMVRDVLGMELKTERAVQIEIVDNLLSLRYPCNDSYRAEVHASAERLIAALAAKRGVSATDLRTELDAKAHAKFRKG